MNNTIEYYNKNSKKLSCLYEEANVSHIQKILLETFKDKPKILEIGCGSGRDASFMQKNNFDIKAIDGSKNMINEALNNHPNLEQRIFCQNIPKELIFNEKFDGIYSIATIMHLEKEEINLTIKKIYELLNLNGLLLLSISLERKDVNKEGLDINNRFFNILLEEDWIKILKSHNFNILNTIVFNDSLNRDGIKWLTLIAQK